jgi:formate hydrogenlyase subunit 6/NADH:ubiquinone oxidoreductase subunit I
MAYFKMAFQTLKNLISKPATLMYPYKPRVFFKNTRGQLNIEFDKCIYCGMCQRRCPTDAILTDRTAKTWQIDHMKCIYCGNCVEVCPKKCLFLANKYAESVTGERKGTAVEKHQAPASTAAAPDAANEA